MNSRLIKGHFPEGKVTILELTESQKAFLDLARHCSSGHPQNITGDGLISNEHTPYVFRLTREQSMILKKEAGFSPKRFAIVESYRGDNEVEFEVNIINRFSENEFEVPHKLLMSDDKAHDWEVNIIGWLPNPLENINPHDIESQSGVEGITCSLPLTHKK